MADSRKKGEPKREPRDKPKDEGTEAIGVAGNEAEAASASPAPIVADHETAPTTAEAEKAEDGGDPPADVRRAKRGHVFVTYRGHADVARLSGADGAQFKFEPGVPVEIPKGIAEELLTTPFEEFETAAEVAVPLQVEE
jgi:hypothetical protein